MFRLLSPLFDVEGGAGSGLSDASPSVPVTTAAVTAQPAPVVPVAPVAPLLHNALRAGAIKEPIIIPATERPVIPVATVEEIDFGGRKVKVSDPIIHDLAKDYKELAGTLTKESQRVKDLEADNQRLKTLNTQAPVIPTPALESTEPVKPSAEKLKAMNDQYLEMAYEDPVGAQLWLYQQPEFQQLMNPIQKQQVESVLTENQKAEKARQDDFQAMRVSMEGKYPDFKDMVPHMMEAVKQFPTLAEKMINGPSLTVLEETYHLAKLIGGQPPSSPDASEVPATPPVAPTQPPAQARTLEQMLADPEVMKQIMANQVIKNQIITNYVSSVSNMQQTLPVVLGDQPGGAPPAMPKFEPKDIRGAGKEFRDFIRRNPSI